MIGNSLVNITYALYAGNASREVVGLFSYTPLGNIFDNSGSKYPLPYLPYRLSA